MHTIELLFASVLRFSAAEVETVFPHRMLKGNDESLAITEW